MNRARRLALGTVALLALAGCDSDNNPVENLEARAEARRQAVALLERLDDPEVVQRIVELGEVDPLIDATAAEQPPRRRRLAMIALGRFGGDRARDRLLELIHENTGDPLADGPTHLYASVGLTLLADPGTAIDLLLRLGYNNPDDNISALAGEENSQPYFTVDAQICDALLTLGIYGAEEDLVRQLRRHDRIRVLIDAHAVLRRHTGIDLPFRYNGSYTAKNADADAWQERLRATRAERRARNPFPADNPRFRERCAEVVGWLGAKSVNNRLIAHKVLEMCGPPAVPQLIDALRSDNPVSQRQAAYVLGRIGDPAAGPPLVEALAHRDAEARADAVSALRALGWRDAAPRILELLKDSDAEVRASAATYLGALGIPDALGPVEAALEKEQLPGTATSMAAAAFRLGGPWAPRLIGIFETGEQIDRAVALAALLEGPPPPAGHDAVVKALGGIDEQAEPDARMEAAKRLRALWEKR